MYHFVLNRLLLPTAVLLLIGQPLCAAPGGEGDQKPAGPPPMLVAVADIVSGSAEPLAELVGTVRYARISEVAGEVAGIVDRVSFDEGERVKAGQPLVTLDSDLLAARIAATRAAHAQVVLQLERERKDLERISALHREDSIAATVYDDQRYLTLKLEKQVEELQATLQRQLLEEQKTTIRAPFAGLVLEQTAEKGEWAAAAAPVAVVADDSEVDIVVDVPQRLLEFLERGKEVAVRCAGHELTARFNRLVPRGDVATRTFEIKLRLKNSVGLIEGMEAFAFLPSGPATQGLLVPRDAVLNSFGTDVVFTVSDGVAHQHPVTILGYAGDRVAVSGPDLAAGQQVVVKGNERIRDGQAVRTGE